MPPKKTQKDPGPAKVKPDLVRPLVSPRRTLLPLTFRSALQQSFGLKNKNKSAKVQARVSELNAQAAMRGKNQASQDKEKEKAALVARKAAEQRKKDEVASLFTPIDIIQPKVPFGVGALD